MVNKDETKQAKEEVLKDQGIRPVKVRNPVEYVCSAQETNAPCITQNAFWDIENMDVHLATSFDRLHAY